MRNKLDGKRAASAGRLTFLTEAAGEAVHALALLPGPVIQAGAPMSAGAGCAGSFQSRTSADTQTNNQTVRRRRGWGVAGGDELPCLSSFKKKKIKKICMLKDPSWPFTGRHSGILQCVSSVRNLPFRWRKASFSSSRGLEQMSHGWTSRRP